MLSDNCLWTAVGGLPQGVFITGGGGGSYCPIPNTTAAGQQCRNGQAVAAPREPPAPRVHVHAVVLVAAPSHSLAIGARHAFSCAARGHANKESASGVSWLGQDPRFLCRFLFIDEAVSCTEHSFVAGSLLSAARFNKNNNEEFDQVSLDVFTYRIFISSCSYMRRPLGGV